MMRCCRLLVILFAFALPALGAAPAPTRYQTLLARECDDLINSAAKRPYGWAWGEVDESDQVQRAGAKVIRVSLAPGATPAAGVVLLYSSELLREPKYAQAAQEVARGIAAAQQRSGKFAAIALLGPSSATSKEPLRPLPDRASTRAALALLLSLVSQDKPRETIDRAAARGAVWLSRQQAESGAWLVMYPPNASPTEGTRLVRLDNHEVRDSILAMTLAYETLGDPIQRRSVERSVDFLLKARIAPTANIGAGLWRGAYTAKAMAFEHKPDFPAGFDSLASRYCMQTLLSTWVVLGEDTRLAACGLASKSLDNLMKSNDNAWHRQYGLKGESLDPAPDAQGNSTFGSDQPEKPALNDPELAATMQTIAAASQSGRDPFREKLRNHFSIRQNLAIVVCGLSDDPMSLDFPAKPDEVDAYLKRHPDLFAPLQTSAGITDISGRVKRLWAIYLRARIEKELGV